MWWYLPMILCFLPVKSDRFPDDYGHLSADSLKGLHCPQCKPIQTGDFRRYWVMYHYKRGEHYLSQTHINKVMTAGVRVLPRFFKAMVLYPVVFNGSYEPLLFQVDEDNYFKLFQIPDEDGNYKYPPERGITLNTPSNCYHNIKHPNDHRNKAIFYNDHYISDINKAYDVKTVCKDETTKTSADSYLVSQKIDGYNSTWLKNCMDAKLEGTCVINHDSDRPLYRSTTRTPIYMRNGLLVYVHCSRLGTQYSEDRCAYFIYDNLTKTDWYIPDTIDFSKKVLTGLHNIQYLVPLIALDDPFFETKRRFQYSNVTIPSTQTPSTSTTTLPKTKTTLTPEVPKSTTMVTAVTSTAETTSSSNESTITTSSTTSSPTTTSTTTTFETEHDEPITMGYKMGANTVGTAIFMSLLPGLLLLY